MVTGIYDRGGLSDYSDKLISRHIIDGIDVNIINIKYNHVMTNYHRIISFLKYIVVSLFVIIKIKNVDVVFATSTPLTITIPGMLASCLYRCPFIFEVRDLWPEIPIKLQILKNPIVILAAKLLELISYSKSTKIIALSPGIKDGILSHTIIDSRDVSIVMNSSDVELFRVDRNVGKLYRTTLGIKSERPLLVYAGAVGRVNGIDYLVRIAEEMLNINKNFAFAIVGDGIEKEKVIRLAKEKYLLNENVFIYDPVPRDKLAPLLSSASLLSSFVIPNKVMENNSANKFFDAFAAGKPVVINYGGWQAELLRKTDAGLQIHSNDPKKAAISINEFINSSEKMKKSEVASKKLGDEVFNRLLLADDMEKVFYQALKEYF